MISNKQKLELTWVGKNNPEYDIANIEPRILEERTDLSYGDKDTENMIIHGDNLLALKALLPEYEGKVKCIYIDPPYNTGNAFEHYDDNVEHSTWLSLMKPRLEILRMLLHPTDGSLWVSIDDYEAPYLRVLLDEVFGRECFVASNVWQKRYSRENREAIGDVHEYILTYARNPLKFKALRNLLPLNDEQKKVYKNPNNDPRGPWRTIPITAQSGHATKSQFYTISGPNGKTFDPPNGNCWRFSKDAFEKLKAAGRIYFGKDGNSQPTTIRYLSEVDGAVPWTWWPHEEVGHTDEAKKEMLTLSKGELFATPKPERLIHRIIYIATKPGDLVLDSFLGSGTTAAVGHKMGRKYIGIEMGNHAYTHVQTRLKKVVDGNDGLKLSEELEWKGGGGFKFYELAPSFITSDEFGNPVIDEFYNEAKLIKAMCKIMNYTYKPSKSEYWKHGMGQVNNFIYVTTQMLSSAMIQQISSHLGQNETLLICPKKFEPGSDKIDSRITIKKIPQSVLKACHFGKKEYLLPIKESAIEEIDLEDETND